MEISNEFVPDFTNEILGVGVSKHVNIHSLESGENYFTAAGIAASLMSESFIDSFSRASGNFAKNLVSQYYVANRKKGSPNEQDILFDEIASLVGCAVSVVAENGLALLKNLLKNTDNDLFIKKIIQLIAYCEEENVSVVADITKNEIIGMLPVSRDKVERIWTMERISSLHDLGYLNMCRDTQQSLAYLLYYIHAARQNNYYEERCGLFKKEERLLTNQGRFGQVMEYLHIKKQDIEQFSEQYQKDCIDKRQQIQLVKRVLKDVDYQQYEPRIQNFERAFNTMDYYKPYITKNNKIGKAQLQKESKRAMDELLTNSERCGLNIFGESLAILRSNCNRHSDDILEIFRTDLSDYALGRKYDDVVIGGANDILMSTQYF